MKRRVTAGGRTLEYTLIQTVCAQAQVQALPGGQLRVYAPRSMSLKQADALVIAHAQELTHAQQALDKDQRCNGGSILLEGQPNSIVLRKGETRSEAVDGAIRLTLEHPERAEDTRAALAELLCRLAQARIRERIAHYHARIGGSLGKVTVEELGIKWGACDRAHDLRFNPRLIMAPPEALDYVVIHELCHLHEFSHSPRFWKMVKAQMPAYEVWKKWLSVHKEELRI